MTNIIHLQPKIKFNSKNNEEKCLYLSKISKAIHLRSVRLFFVLFIPIDSNNYKIYESPKILKFGLFC